MKKLIPLVCFLLTMVLAVPALAYTAGDYEGTAQGMGGELRVRVSLSQDRIEQVSVTAHSETAGISDPALEALPGLIVGSQSLALDAVAGATITSGAILSAVEDALTKAGADIALLKKPLEKASSGESESIQADVVVVGAGGAGVSAAITAADAGAGKVVLLEKMPQIGGTTCTSQGLFGGFDTQIGKALGIEVTYDQMYDNLMNNASYRLDPQLTAITVAESGKTIDYLQERMGVPFLKDNVMVGYGPLQMMHIVDGAGEGLRAAFTASLEAAGVTVLTNTRAERLLLNEDGSVAGVVAASESGELTVHAGAVVLATGGYANNPQLTARLNPEMAATFGIGFAGATGDGLIMASNAGALITHTGHLMAVLKDYEIMARHNGTSATANVSQFIAMPNLVMVGKDGTRFVDEKSGGYMTQELNGPVFDQINRDGTGYVWAISDRASLDDKGVVRGLDMSFIEADTAEELAQKMGVDAAALETTLSQYNHYVEAGHDPEFGRTALAALKAPYVAVAVVPCEIITYGGVARNQDAQVIRADGTAIPGLYAAGEVSANSAYMGFTLSNCVTWGRIAGANAARWAQ